MMICSAPSRLAAMTPHRPTAPSPTTATLLPGAHLRGDRRVVAGAHHVREGEKRGHQRVVFADRQGEQGAVGLGNAQRLGLRAVQSAAVAEEAAVNARRLQPLVAEHAGAVGRSEGHDDDLAAPDRLDVAADLLDDADRLVAHALAGSTFGPSLYGHRSLPQMQARVTRITASVGSTMAASGTFSIRTSWALYMTVARIGLSPKIVKLASAASAGGEVSV